MTLFLKSMVTLALFCALAIAASLSLVHAATTTTTKTAKVSGREEQEHREQRLFNYHALETFRWKPLVPRHQQKQAGRGAASLRSFVALRCHNTAAAIQTLGHDVEWHRLAPGFLLVFDRADELPSPPLSLHRYCHHFVELPPTAKLHRRLHQRVFPFTLTKHDENQAPTDPSQEEILVTLAKGTETSVGAFCDETQRALLSRVEPPLEAKSLQCGSPSTRRQQGRRSNNDNNKVVIKFRTNDNERAFIDALLLVAAADNVRWIEPYQHRIFRTLNDVATKTLQHFDQQPSVAHPLWDANITGTGQLIAIGDTGLDYDSCYFRDDSADKAKGSVVFYPNVNWRHRKLVSYVECVREDGTLEHGDALGAHGTHVAGSAAGQVQPAAAAAANEQRYNGFAKDAKIFFHDLTCSGDQGLYLPGDMYDFYVPGHETGAAIFSNSWGSDAASAAYDSVDRETDLFCYNNQNMLVVFAAGNSPFLGILSPASSKNVLTVGAHLNSLTAVEREALAGFSAHGPTYDSRIKPEITAPGQVVHSAHSDGSLSTNQCATEGKSGTSMATPFVSASATLLRQYLQEGYYPHGSRNSAPGITPSASLLKAMLINAGEDMTAVAGGIPNANEGFGRLELQSILHLKSVSATPQHAVYLHNNVSLRPKATWSRCYVVSSHRQTGAGSGAIDIKATLAWIDAASASEGSHHSLVNDLDLVVANTTDGAVTYSNGAASSAFDRINNVEQTELVASSSPPNEQEQQQQHIVQVFVYAYDVTDTRWFHGSQPFSVVVKGPPDMRELDSCDKATGGASSRSLKCPNACSGHGTCDQHTGTCRCDHGYHHVDCSLCDGDVVCRGNGQCGAATQQCTCDSNHFADAACSTCVSGWFGPHCAGNCECGAHGTCDEATGICNCDRNTTTGHWAGDACQFCDTDFAGAGCDTPSYWCHNKGTRHIHLTTDNTADSPAIVQVNGVSHYANSLSCRWLLQAPYPHWNIKLLVRSMDIEKPYDYVSLYNGAAPAHTQLIKYFTGKVHESATVSAGSLLLVDFESDLYGPGAGFVLEASVVKADCADADCHEHGRCDAAEQRCVCADGYDAATNCLNKFGEATPAPSSSPSSTASPATPRPPQQSTAPSFRCVDRTNSCSSHGDCCFDASCCLCDQGYGGLQCSVRCPDDSIIGQAASHSLSPCNGVGDCVAKTERGDAGYACKCPSGYSGASCQVQESRDVAASVGATASLAAPPMVHLSLPVKPQQAPSVMRLVVYQVPSLSQQHALVTTHITLLLQEEGKEAEVFIWNSTDHAGVVSKAMANFTASSAATAFANATCIEVISPPSLVITLPAGQSSVVSSSQFVVGVRMKQATTTSTSKQQQEEEEEALLLFDHSDNVTLTLLSGGANPYAHHCSAQTTKRITTLLRQSYTDTAGLFRAADEQQQQEGEGSSKTKQKQRIVIGCAIGGGVLFGVVMSALLRQLWFKRRYQPLLLSPPQQQQQQPTAAAAAADLTLAAASSPSSTARARRYAAATTATTTTTAEAGAAEDDDAVELTEFDG